MIVVRDYIVSPLAEQDIEAILSYLVQENPQAALKFKDHLLKAFDLLCEHPQLGHKRPDLTANPALFWPLKWRYTVIYHPTEPLEIVRVLSGYQDIINIL